MTTRSLTIQIDPAGLRTLADAGQQVALVKSDTNPRYAVVWHTVRPTRRSAVRWEGTYQVYASTTTAHVGGATLQPVAIANAVGGCTYPLAEGRFSAGAPDLPVCEIGLHNLDYQIAVDGTTMVVGGAAEVADVDGQPLIGPLTAQAVRFGEIAVTTLTERVLVFPASGVRSGVLIDWEWLANRGKVPPEAGIVLGTPLAVDLTTTTAQTIQYDDTVNAFVPAAAMARTRSR